MKNIIISNIKKAMLVIAVISVMSACEDNEIEEKFDKPYTERVETQIEELHNSLMASEHGWKTVYITDKDVLGGFNFIFKFTGENTVEMASDFSPADTVFRSSEYAIKNASTVKLSFITQNAIHRLSDSGNSPISGEDGSGYKGDSEFLYYGKAENGEDLIFRGNKTNGNPADHAEIRFVKAESNELDNIRTAFKNRIKITPLLLGNGKSVYRRLSIIKNGVKTTFSYNYNSSLLFLNVTAEDDSESFSSPIYFTEKGFVISNIKAGTEEFKDVEIPLSSYDVFKDQFTATIENGTVIMGSGVGPLQPVDGHKQIIDPTIVSRLVYFHRDDDLPEGLTTSGFEALYEAARVTTTRNPNGGFSFRFAFYNDLDWDGTPRDVFLIPTDDGNIRSLYTYDNQSDRIVFIHNGYLRNSDGDLLSPTRDRHREMLDFLFDDEGFYVENLGSVTQFTSHIYTFTSVKNPSIRVAFYNL